MSSIEFMLSGAVAACWMLAGIFFLRFWRQTNDRFFLYFVASFWLEAFNRVAAALLVAPDEDAPIWYVFRLLAYVLIIVAIWQKNRTRPRQ
jgi:hypothetical protein